MLTFFFFFLLSFTYKLPIPNRYWNVFLLCSSHRHLKINSNHCLLLEPFSSSSSLESLLSRTYLSNCYLLLSARDSSNDDWDATLKLFSFVFFDGTSGSTSFLGEVSEGSCSSTSLRLVSFLDVTGAFG
jgi:hypothetical protein